LIFASIVMLIAFPVQLASSTITNLFPSLSLFSLSQTQIVERIVRIFCNYLAIIFLGRYPFSIDEKYPGSYYAVMFFTPLINISIMYTLKNLIEAFTVVHIIGSCIFVLEFITYYMMWQTTTEYNRRIRSELVNQQMKYEVQYMNNLNEVVNEYHHLRHDMKNHITCMDLLLSQEKYEELKSYFYTLNKKVYAIDCQIETGNFLVNQVINMKYVTAESMNIPLEIHAKLPKKLNILDIRLCSLLSNLLDNAIEASEKIKDPFISVEMSVVKCYLAIKVSNRIEDWQKPKALAFGTTKENTKLHGFGKHIIEKIVKKCNGTLDYEVKDDMFTVSILLLLEEDNEEEAEKG